jgi:hypothetical protein
MRHPHPRPFRGQAAPLRRQFLQDGGLPFTDVLAEDVIADALAAAGGWLDRVFSPLATLRAFLEQVLGPDHSCRAAVARLVARRTARGQRPCSARTGAYCRARRRLPEALFWTAACSVGRAPDARAERGWLWNGRRVYLFDGTTAAMPDTPANRAAYPQAYNQKPGLGSPIARVGAVVSSSCGAVVGLGFCRYAGKGQGEVSLRRRLWGVLAPGDALLADRLAANRAAVQVPQGRGVEPVSRLNRARRGADFRRGRRLGPDGHAVRWPEPTSVRPLDRAAYRALPESITAREARVRVTQPGFRPRSVVVVTTLLDPKRAAKEGRAGLYRARWNAEPDLRSIRSAMRMGELRGKAPELARKGVWAHAPAYDLTRTVMARAAGRHGVPARPVSFTGALQTPAAFQPLLELGAAGAAGRVRVCRDLLDAVAAHRVGGRPGRYEPRLRKRRRSRYDWRTRPRAEIRRKMARGAQK